MVSVLLDGVSKRYASGLALEGLTIRLEDGDAVALLGPSGSGKTTVLRIVAGLDQADTGDVLFDGETVTTTPPAQRNVAMVFQDTVLYPFLDVRANVEFPLTARRVPAPEIAKRVEAEARALGIARLLRRKPGQLSAGQRHIVQMAKAMVRSPSLLLVDEPFGRLDPATTRRMRTELRMLQQGYGVTALYATHDQEDAMALADRVAVMEAGRVRQVGTPDEVYRRPSDTFVATFVGSPQMGLLRGASVAGGIAISDLTLRCPVPPRGEVLVGVRPEAWELSKRGIAAEVTRVTNVGPHSFTEISTSAGPATVRWGQQPPATGTKVALLPTSYHLFDPATGRAVYHSG